MSNRYQGGIIRPGYNPLKVANPPTIGCASSAGATSVSVPFTAPSCIGGGAITSYTAYASCGSYSSSGSSSPLTVTGLTTGVEYTFKVIATNAFGPSGPSAASNAVTPQIAPGCQSYTSAGTYCWVAPSCVTTVKVTLVGGGGGGHGGLTGICSPSNGSGAGGGAGGYGLASVTPGCTYTVVVGAQGNRDYNCASGTNGGNSSFASTVFVAGGGGGASRTVGGSGGTVSGSGSWCVSASGGNGGNINANGSSGAAGGGAGGSTSTGKNGGNATFTYGGGGGGGTPDGFGGSAGGGCGTTAGGRAKPTGAEGYGGSYGGGGGGGSWYCFGSNAAGNGKPGFVLLEWGGGI